MYKGVAASVPVVCVLSCLIWNPWLNQPLHVSYLKILQSHVQLTKRIVGFQGLQHMLSTGYGRVWQTSFSLVLEVNAKEWQIFYKSTRTQQQTSKSTYTMIPCLLTTVWHRITLQTFYRAIHDCYSLIFLWVSSVPQQSWIVLLGLRKATWTAKVHRRSVLLAPVRNPGSFQWQIAGIALHKP